MNKRNRWIISVAGILLMISLMTGCSLVSEVTARQAPPHLSPGSSSRVISNEAFEYGIGVQIHTGTAVDLNVTHISPPLSLDSALSSDTALSLDTVTITGTVRLGNHNADNNRFRLTALLNYEQISSTMNQQTAVLHYVDLPPFASQEIDFSLEIPNQAGRYKLWWLVFAFPDSHDLDMNSRIRQSITGGFASDILVGEAGEFPLIAYQLVPAFSAYLIGGPLINRDPAPQTGWFTDTVRSGEIVDYFIHFGQPERAANFALIAFLDGLQIPLRHDAPGNVFWGTIGANSQSTIPASVQIPGTAAIHELETLYIPDPFGPEGTIAVQQTTPRGQTWGSGLSRSIRVGLAVMDR
jgi:hypothetical protein